jgi:hypothetical protein
MITSLERTCARFATAVCNGPQGGTVSFDLVAIPGFRVLQAAHSTGMDHGAGRWT